MLYFVFSQALSFLLDLFTVRRLSDHQKDMHILLLRQQVRILQRKHSNMTVSYTHLRAH